MRETHYSSQELETPTELSKVRIHCTPRERERESEHMYMQYMHIPACIACRTHY